MTADIDWYVLFLVALIVLLAFDEVHIPQKKYIVKYHRWWPEFYQIPDVVERVSYRWKWTARLDAHFRCLATRHSMSSVFVVSEWQS